MTNQVDPVFKGISSEFHLPDSRDSTIAALQSRIAALLVRVGVLEEALDREWAGTHENYCAYPCRGDDSTCEWPRPKALALTDPAAAQLVVVARAAYRMNDLVYQKVNAATIGDMRSDLDDEMRRISSEIAQLCRDASPEARAILGGGS